MTGHLLNFEVDPPPTADLGVGKEVMNLNGINAVETPP